MRYLRWIVTIPLAVAIVVFSVNNRESMLIDPWPFGEPLFVPMYVLVFGAAAAGFLAGSTLQWLSNAPGRVRSRRKSSQIGKLEAELSRLKEATPAGTSSSGGVPATTQPVDAI